MSSLVPKIRLGSFFQDIALEASIFTKFVCVNKTSDICTVLDHQIEMML